MPVLCPTCRAPRRNDLGGCQCDDLPEPAVMASLIRQLDRAVRLITIMRGDEAKHDARARSYRESNITIGDAELEALRAILARDAESR